MPDLDPVVFDFIVRTNKFTADTRQASARFTTETRRMERASADLRSRLERDSGAIGATLKGLGGSFAAYLGGQQIAGMIDSYTRLQNSLRVAGLEGAALEAAQSRLLATAQKYGVEVGALTNLFGTLSQASKELGVSQADVFKLTDAVSASLKISGISAEGASGALLQLGQTLRGGRVQAEEYNSLIDGLYPLLEAAANGSARFGGSVAKLTTLVKDGKVNSREFFDAIVAGTAQLETKAAKAADTLSGAVTHLTNALTVYVGESAKANGATNALVGGIDLLAQNIDTIIPAIALLGAALGVGIVTNAIRARAAVAGTGAALYAAFGGGIGLTITAVAGTLAAFGSETATTARLVEDSKAATERYEATLKAAAAAASTAATGQAGVGNQSANAVPKINAFAGATGRAAEKLYELARAQRAAAIEALQARKTAADTRINELGARTPQGRETGRESNRAALRRGDILGISVGPLVGEVRNLLSGGRVDREVQTELAASIADRDRLAADIRKLRAQPVASFLPRGARADGTGAPGGGGGRSGGAGRARGGGAGAGASPVDRGHSELDRLRSSLDTSTYRITEGISEDGQRALDAWWESAGAKADEFMREEMARADRARDYRLELLDEEADARDAIERRRVDGIYATADLFETLFRDGTTGVWDQFKSQGLAAVAVVAAALIKGKSLSEGLGLALDGGGLGGSAGGIFGAIFGRASGGYVPPNGVVRVNENRGGVELLRMGSQGGTVIPLGQANAVARAPTPTPTVVQLVVGRGQMFEPAVRAISGQVSVQTVQSAAPGIVNAAVRATPEHLARNQRFGSR